MFVLVNQLRQLLEAEFGAAQNALNEITAITGDTLTDFHDLSDADKLELGLSTAVSDQLVVDDVIGQINQFVNSSGRAAIFAQLRDHQNQSAIRVQQTATDGFASSITTLTADVATTSAAIATETTARADGDTALATDITTVSTSVAGNSTTITQHQASIDGIEAEWGVTINGQGQVIGLIRLDADQSESTFTVVVDKFQVAKTDGTGIVPIFQVGTVGGASRVALAGDMLVDGAIVAQHIGAGQVTAGKVAADAITATEINVSTLSAMAANMGTVTAGRIQSADGLSFWDLSTNVFQIGT
tara:strand:+ start:33 stop:935 length:903 start_codon:yes stop_codon:yes gene_type:complete